MQTESLTPARKSDLRTRLSPSRIARILVQHGIPSDSPDLANLALSSDGTCTLSEIRDYLGY